MEYLYRTEGFLDAIKERDKILKSKGQLLPPIINKVLYTKWLCDIWDLSDCRGDRLYEDINRLLHREGYLRLNTDYTTPLYPQYRYDTVYYNPILTCSKTNEEIFEIFCKDPKNKEFINPIKESNPDEPYPF